MISRVAASILIADGMQHLIARNLDVPSPPPVPSFPSISPVFFLYLFPVLFTAEA